MSLHHAHDKVVGLRVTAFFWSVALVLPFPAGARPVSAGGSYQESFLPGAAPSVGVIPSPITQAIHQTIASALKAPGANFGQVVSRQQSSAPVQTPVPAAVTTTAAAQMRSWVAEKWSSVQSLWSASGPSSSNSPSAPSVSSAKPSSSPSAPSRSLPVAKKIEEVGGRRTTQGVPVYNIKGTEIPRLSVEREDRVRASRYFVEGRNLKVLEERIIHPFETPDVLNEKQMKALGQVAEAKVVDGQKIREVEFQPKGRVSREGVDRIARLIRPENALALKPYVALSPEEMRFLSGLLLYQDGHKCAAAIGLFHSLTHKAEWETESNYYLAMCSRELGLESDYFERARRVLNGQDSHYARKMLKDLAPEVPNEFIEPLGLAVAKAVGNKKVSDGLDAKTNATIAYILSLYGAHAGNYKTTIAWAHLVPESHSKYIEAQFLLALAEYQAGSKEKSAKIQERLLANIKTEKAADETQALVALNAARVYFQEKDFKSAHNAFLKVAKDHPQWLQSLTEMGWVQLMRGDYEGAIGNMYSIQSPYFNAVYKPESYVIRTIGYLNLCQYGDAYRMLSVLEHDYRPKLEMIDRFVETAASRAGVHYQAVRALLSAAKEATQGAPRDIEGLPAVVVREMARHRDFINLQKSLNRQIDERAVYVRLDAEVDKSLKNAQGMAENARRRQAELRKNLAMIPSKPDSEQNRNLWMGQLTQESRKLEDYLFMVDLFSDAKAALPKYRSEMLASADQRIVGTKNGIEKALNKRLAKIRQELARILENNELLRYEVFAGSGENIRYQVAGGEKGNRVPASVQPKSKTLQWNFDGEYWEDEIGHYRSSLKNNCPESGRRNQARADGGSQ
jgi:tetratricopeptide (TPR) repeat protein